MNYYKCKMDYVLDRDVLLFLYDYFRSPLKLFVTFLRAEKSTAVHTYIIYCIFNPPNFHMCLSRILIGIFSDSTIYIYIVLYYITAVTTKIKKLIR